MVRSAADAEEGVVVVGERVRLLQPALATREAAAVKASRQDGIRAIGRMDPSASDDQSSPRMDRLYDESRVRFLKIP